MEKEGRKVRYFVKLVESVGKKVVPTTELYKIIKDTDKEFGYSSNYDGRCTNVTAEFIQVLGDKLEVVVDNGTKAPGRMIPRWFSIKGSVEEAKKDVILYFNKKEAERVRKMKSSETKHKGATKPFIKRFWKFLIAVKKEGTDIMTFQRMKELSGLSIFNNNTIEAWKASLKTVGIDFEFVVKSGGGNKVQLIGLNNTIIQTAEVLEKAFPGETFDSKEVLGLGKMKRINPAPTSFTKIEVVEREKPKSEKETEEAGIMFAVGGVIKSNGGTRVDIDVLVRCLRDAFKINTSKNEVTTVLKKREDLFDIIGFGQSVKLINNDASWAEIKMKYGPQNFKKDFLVRLGMSLEEIKTRVPEMEVELISKISEFDGIYRIIYDYSAHHKKQLVRLYRTFRQNDKILDDKVLEDLLRREIEVIDGRSYKDDLKYNIENI